jgi:topoisomerase-4 subunit A
VLGIATLSAAMTLSVASGSRQLAIKGADLQHYMGKRGLRGHLLPRGYQKVNGLTVV